MKRRARPKHRAIADALCVICRCRAPRIPAKGKGMLRWISSSLLLVACASSTIQAPVKKPDGSWHLKCGATLDNCVKQGEDLCKGRGYVVLSGVSKRTLYGAELGASRYEVRECELDIACADNHGNLPTVQYGPPAPAPGPTVLSSAPSAPTIVAPPPAPVAPAPAPVAPAPAPVVPAPAPAAVAPAPAPTPASAH